MVATAVRHIKMMHYQAICANYDMRGQTAYIGTSYRYESQGIILGNATFSNETFTTRPPAAWYAFESCSPPSLEILVHPYVGLGPVYLLDHGPSAVIAVHELKVVGGANVILTLWATPHGNPGFGAMVSTLASLTSEPKEFTVDCDSDAPQTEADAVAYSAWDQIVMGTWSTLTIKGAAYLPQDPTRLIIQVVVNGVPASFDIRLQQSNPSGYIKVIFHARTP